MQPHEMQPPDNDRRRRKPQRGGAADGWGLVPIILGVAAIVIATLLFFSGDQNDPFPATGHDAPRTDQAPTK
jgi:hypothetical protein